MRQPWEAFVIAGLAGLGFGVGLPFGALLVRVVARFLKEPGDGP